MKCLDFLFFLLKLKRNSTCGLESHPHLVGAHGARFVQVKLPEYGLDGGMSRKRRDTEDGKKPRNRETANKKISPLAE